MSERKKLILELNTPTEITLLYSDPVMGNSQYGEYFMYAVQSGNEEYAFFAPVEIHKELDNYGKGDSFVITKLAAQRGTKLITKFAVEPRKNGNGIHEVNSILNGKDIEEDDETSPVIDIYYDVILQSYKDAIAVQKEIGILSDVTLIAITLFIARSK